MLSALRIQRSVIPGFGLTLGITLFYLGLMVLLPLATLFLRTGEMSMGELAQYVWSPRALAAIKLSFGAAFVAALINACVGLLVAWVLVRYAFPFKRVVDGMIDLPFALPTAVAGIALTSLYASNGWIGGHLEAFGVKVAYAPLGVVVALVFVGFPFTVRTVQPVLQELDRDLEDAAACLGAGAWRTFLDVILPALRPSILTGFSLAFARGLGEYGSIVFISGNLPLKTEIVPLLIMARLEQFDYRGASALALVMLLASFTLLFIVNVLQLWAARQGRTA